MRLELLDDTPVRGQEGARVVEREQKGLEERNNNRTDMLQVPQSTE